MATPNADDIAHYTRIREAKARVLEQLDLQAAKYGERDVPAHIEVDRAQLRSEIQVLDSVIGAPLHPDISEILGQRGRFVAEHEQIRQLRQEMREANARLSEQLGVIVRSIMRRDIILVVIVVVVVALAMVMLFWIGRISGPSGAWVSWILALK